MPPTSAKAELVENRRNGGTDKLGRSVDETMFYAPNDTPQRDQLGHFIIVLHLLLLLPILHSHTTMSTTTDKAARRKRFEDVFPVIAEELSQYLKGEGMPKDAVDWYEKVSWTGWDEVLRSCAEFEL